MSPLAASAFTRSAFLFVDFFFVLSGFVIAAGYANRMATGGDIRRFIFVRFGRLYPLHLFMIAAFAGFEMIRLVLPQLAGGGAPVFGGPTDPVALIPNLLLLQGAGFMDELSWNAVSWSISTEFIAYALFAAVVWLLGARSWLAFAAAVLVGPLVLLAFSPRYMDATYDFGLIRCLYGFALGALLHGFAGSGIRAGKRQLHAAGPGAVSLWSVAELVTIAMIGAYISWAGPGPAGIAAPFVFAAALFVFAHEGGLVSQLLKGRMFLWLGAISYSVYMVHLFVQGRMINVARLLDKFAGTNLIGEVTVGGDVATGFTAASPAQGLALTAIMIALVLAAATVTCRLVEKPSLTWFRRRAKTIE